MEKIEILKNVVGFLWAQIVSSITALTVDIKQGGPKVNYYQRILVNYSVG
jgi:hypothetical protein